MEAIIVNIVPSAAKAAFPGMYRQMFCLSAIIPISPVNRNKNIYFSFFFGYFDEAKTDIRHGFRYFSHTGSEISLSRRRFCFPRRNSRYLFSRVSEFFLLTNGIPSVILCPTTN